MNGAPAHLMNQTNSMYEPPAEEFRYYVSGREIFCLGER
jgi:hypothetical protein